MGEPGSSLLTPVSCSTQLSIPGSSLTTSISCNIQTSSAPCDTNYESSLKAQSKTDEACVQSTSDHCKMGSWWKQDLETRRASSSLLAATEPGAAIKSGDFWEGYVLVYANKQIILHIYNHTVYSGHHRYSDARYQLPN